MDLEQLVHRSAFAAVSVLDAGRQGRLLRGYFDWWHRRPDPWRLATSQAERHKYKVTLSQIPDGSYRHVLDIGCSEGTFTLHAADTFGEAKVTGIDVSGRALARAMQSNPPARVRFVEANIVAQAPPSELGPCDLIFCSEVLYYLGRDERLRKASRRMRELLMPGGVLVAVHPWPEAVRLHRHLDADPQLERLGEHVDEATSQTFAVTIYRRTHERPLTPHGQARYSFSAPA